MLLTQHQLSVMCEICCKFPAEQNVRSMSAHKLCVRASHFSLLKWETPTFISLGLWPQHPNTNPVKYKICSEMQRQVYLRKVCNTNGPTLWAGWQGLALCVICNATDKWCKRLQVCVTFTANSGSVRKFE